MKRSEIYLEKHTDSGIKVGDSVLLKRVAKDYEKGWKGSWVSPMGGNIGRVGQVITDNYEAGFDIAFPGESYVHFTYPYFVLKSLKGA